MAASARQWSNQANTSCASASEWQSGQPNVTGNGGKTSPNRTPCSHGYQWAAQKQQRNPRALGQKNRAKQLGGAGGPISFNGGGIVLHNNTTVLARLVIALHQNKWKCQMGTYQINCSHMEGKLHLASVVVEQDRSIKRPRSVLSGDLYQSREHQRKDLVRNNVQGASKAFRRTPGLQTPSRLHDAVGLQRYAPRGVAVAPSCRAPPPMKSRVAPCPCCPRPCRVRCWPTYHAVCSAYRAAPPCAMAELLLDGALPLNRSNAKPNKKGDLNVAAVPWPVPPARRRRRTRNTARWTWTR